MAKWDYVTWFVFPSGALLAGMLISGQSLSMLLAAWIANAGVKTRWVKITISSLMTALSLGLVIFSYSGYRRCETMMQGADDVTRALAHDSHMKDLYEQERNLWVSVCSLLVWAATWRLKALHNRRQLTPPHLHHRWFSRGGYRLTYFITGLLAFLVADIPLCRLNYNFQLMMFVTPKKEALISSMPPTCEEAYIATAAGECKTFCAHALELSEERLWATMWARNWHVFGRWGAQFFDSWRGVEQGRDRIDALFDTKTCLQAAMSVDKSNSLANLFCVAVACVSIAVAFSAISNAITESFDEHQFAQYHGFRRGNQNGKEEEAVGTVAY
eukprot:TRINITY_DN45286_c0_g1_i1.p1 TRINITY_DN45286_c0_g1~~TRINITY_DN45286_c0_g1_i1.p1  ORF type:complete len:329 (-),score=68.07 TRINITY_DN45286_c0_g1_i1:117-1103(-)